MSDKDFHGGSPIESGINFGNFLYEIITPDEDQATQAEMTPGKAVKID